MAIKQSFKIQVRGGMVFGKDKGITCILDTGNLIYRIDVMSQKEFSKINLNVGDSVWLYCVPERFKVLTIIKQSDSIDTPPDVEEFVELE